MYQPVEMRGPLFYLFTSQPFGKELFSRQGMPQFLRKTSHINQRESQQQSCQLRKCRLSNVMTVNEANRRENKSSTTVYVDSNMSILLQTANAFVSRIHQPHSAVTMRILFDSGSHWSQISE